jgi:hypothetical protein
MKKIILSTLLILAILPTLGNSAQFYTWRQRLAANCTLLTDGKPSDLCAQLSNNSIYVCNPTDGLTCTTPSEWVAVGTSGGASVNYINSIANTSGNISLVNDNSSPGALKYYGTNALGTKGFNALSAQLLLGNINGLVLGDGVGNYSVAVEGSNYQGPTTFNVPFTDTSNVIGLNINSTNLQVNGSDQLDTIQDIATSSSPTFTGLTLSSLSGVLKASTGVLAGNSTINDLGSPTANFSMNSFNITNLLNPINPQDAATKNYVDSTATGLSPKQAVTVATATTLPANTYANGSSGVGATLTANANGVLTVDGVTVALNDRILVKDEAAQEKNGIYYVSTLGTAGVPYVLTRAIDTDTGAEIKSALVFVAGGTVNTSSTWVNDNASTPTMGTTAITFVQFSSIPSLTFTSPLVNTTGTISLNTSKADGSTLGSATFTAVDFNDNTAGLISIDYTNAQKATALQPGFLTSTDWFVFNAKQPSLGNVSGIVKGNGSGSYSAAVAGTDYQAPLTLPLSLSNGGTNAALTAFNGGIVYSTASSLAILPGTATASKLLMSGASTTPSWSTATYPSAVSTSGTIIQSNGTNFVSSTATWPTTATSNNVVMGDGTNFVIAALTSCSTGSSALTYNTTTKAFGCNTITGASSGSSGEWQVNNGSGAFSAITASTSNNTFNQASGSAINAGLAPTIAQSSTAGYTVLDINPTETSTGSGSKYLLNLRVGGTQKAYITNTGIIGGTGYQNVGSSVGSLYLYELAANGTDYVGFQAPSSVTTSVLWQLPAADSSGCFQSNGSGVITIGACGSSGGTINSGTTGQIPYFASNGTTLTGIADYIYSPTRNASSGTTTALSLAPTWTQTGTAGYTALLINSTETTVGSGSKMLLKAQVAGTDKFTVDDTGAVVTGGAITTGGTGQSSTGYGLLVNSTGQTTANGGDFSVKNSSNTATFTIGATSGVVDKYNTIATVNRGIPSEVAVSNLTAQTAAIAATTIYAVPATGYYRVSWNADLTTAASSSSTLGGANGFQVIYTSPTDSLVKTTIADTVNTSTANTTGTAVSGSRTVYAQTGTNLQYSFGYTSSGQPMGYQLHIVVEAL